MGWKTLDVGEQAIQYHRQGKAEIIDGPSRLYVWPGQKFSLLRRYTADQTEYLSVHYKNGMVEHIPGPHAMFLNTLEINYITVQKAISLDANEALVVYKKDEEGKVVRYIQHGPITFIPKATEWVHEFSWHGTAKKAAHHNSQDTGDSSERYKYRQHPDDPNEKFSKVPNALNFTKLRIIPDQFYYNVEDVRTKDEALIRVKLMVFYELKDIETMLANTQDPMADFINGVCADVVSFASQLTYEEFMDQAEKLNDLSVYPLLMELAKKIGYNVSKVVFRGYHASDQLTRMHEMAIKTRTKLRIDMETQEQQEELTDMKLRSELERSEMEQSLQIEQEQHRLALKKQQQEHDLTMQTKEKIEYIRQMQVEGEAKLTSKKKTDEQMLSHFEKLHSMDVNITEYLLSQNPQPAKVVRVIAPSNQAAVHIHQN
ncbi:uncharacterized protein LOC144442332 [Glandiceps talaboti]